MKNVLKYSSVAVALLATPFALQAAQGQTSARGFNYNYVQGQFEVVDVANIDGDGLRLMGSFELDNKLFVVASYGSINFETNVDYSQLNVGIGYHAPIDSRTDMVFTGSLINAQIDPVGQDDTGYMMTGGVRYSLQSNLELEGGLGYINIFDDTDVGFYAGVVYDFNRDLSLTAQYSTIGDNTDTLSVGLRFAL